jgi:hypothetical protein
MELEGYLTSTIPLLQFYEERVKLDSLNRYKNMPHFYRLHHQFLHVPSICSLKIKRSFFTGYYLKVYYFSGKTQSFYDDQEQCSYHYCKLSGAISQVRELLKKIEWVDDYTAEELSEGLSSDDPCI